MEMPDGAATRVWFITGASRGLGRAFTEAALAAGDRVVGAARDVSSLDEVADRYADRLLALTLDVTDRAAVFDVVDRAVQHFGRLDVVVNNAGFVRDRMIVSCGEDEWDAVLRVHLKGHFAVARFAGEHWRAQAKASEAVDARIVNTSSGAGLLGSVGQSAYSAAKAAIATLTLVQAAEMGRYGVTANAIAPSARTRMTETVFADMMAAPDDPDAFDAMAPENVAPLVVWLGSTESAHVTGRVFEIEGGKVSVADGWQHGPAADKGARWDPAELGPVVDRLLAEAPAPAPVYGAS